MSKLRYGVDVSELTTAFASATDVLDGFQVPLLRLDGEGRIVVHNTAWGALMQPMQSGTDVALHVHPEDLRHWTRMMVSSRGATVGSGGSQAQRLRFVHPRGELRWFDVSLGRNDVGFDMAVHDATGVHRRETALEVAAYSARSLIDGVPAMIYRGRNDREWTMEVVSEGCLALTGYPAVQLRSGLQVTYSSLILTEDTDYVWDTVQAALRQHLPYSLCYRIRCAGGQVKCVFEKGCGIYAENGEVLGIEGAMFELDEAVVGRLQLLR